MSRAPDKSKSSTLSLFRPWVLWGFLLALFFLTLHLAEAWSERAGIENLRQAGGHRLDLYVSSLENALDKYEYLPFILSLNSGVIELLKNPKDAAGNAVVNRYLKIVNEQAKSASLFVLDLTGTALASSNWDSVHSFVGHNYAFRPYFENARKGRGGRFYGIGVTSGEPGYFLSHPVHHGGKRIGVAVAKVGLEKLEQTWEQSAERVMVVDAKGVIFLSSVNPWKFKTLGPLSPEVLGDIARTKQYGSATLEPIPLSVQTAIGPAARVVSLRSEGSKNERGRASEEDFLLQSRVLDRHGWQVIILSPMRPVRAMVRNTVFAAGFVFCFLQLLFFYFRQRRRRIRENIAAKEALQRAHDDLERRITERTADLTAANLLLQQEVADRKRAERVLREAQDELLQAGKMTALGKMSAGITHELNQPLAALRTLCDNAGVLIQRDRIPEAANNLAEISRLVERMGNITEQLKAFARKATLRLVSVPVRRAVSGSLSMFEQRIRAENVSICLVMPEEEIAVLCDEVRLEQVLVNLFRNALDAMKDCVERRLEVAVHGIDKKVSIFVRDSGGGISPEVQPHLFEPFYTTKEVGAGLGLGLAISSGIVKECGGSIRAGNLPDGGAEFVVELQRGK
ncbi:MAG: sensor histidine kinase [Deltaproteobacteria bacterium]|nr:sensor histidine kinase [Deltaproteobacteria bacterium]